MIVNKTSAYTVLSPASDEFGNPENILHFNQEFNKNYTNFKNVNLILDFSNNINIVLEEILLFSQRSEVHKNNNKSFVVVYENIDLDKMSDELIVVPTFQEAVDVIEIEEIERELGI